jgi:NitT/TauT family transport system substrate-binding protein
MRNATRSVTRAALALGAALPLLLAGCAPKTAAPGSGSGPAAPAGAKPFVVSYNDWIGYVGLFTALDKGYFRDAGLDVQPKHFSGPADSVPLLMSGQLDAALTTADTVILLNQRAGANPTDCVYVIDTSDGADGVIAQKSIHTVEDLKGKTVAATPGQCNELLLLKALQAAGMSEKDVKITSMDADTAGAAIIANKVPAAVTWEPWLTKAAAGGGHVIFSSHEAPNTLLDVIAASKVTEDNRAADLKAFVAAYAKGAAYDKAHPDEAAQIAAKHLGSSLSDARTMLTKVKMYVPADNRTLIGTAAAPGSALASAKEIGQFYVDQNQMPAAPDVSKTFVTDYLPQ